MGIFDSVGDVLFGSAPSTQTIAAADKIAPADANEEALYGGLYDSATSGLDYANYLGGQRQGIYDTTMSNMNNASAQMGDLQYNGQLNQQMGGQLQSMYDKNISNIDAYAQQGVGGLMNGMANRGVINSSATGKAMGDMASNVDTMKNDAYNNYQTNYMSAYDNQYSNERQNILDQNTMAMQPYSMVESAYGNAYDDPYNMWSNIRNSRYGLENDYIQTPGTTGLLQSAAGGVAQAGAAALFSDERLKENFVDVGVFGGVPFYRFDWTDEGMKLSGADKRESFGVRAQEVQKVHPEHVYIDEASGFLKVDYEALAGGE